MKRKLQPKSAAFHIISKARPLLILGVAAAALAAFACSGSANPGSTGQSTPTLATSTASFSGESASVRPTPQTAGDPGVQRIVATPIATTATRAAPVPASPTPAPPPGLAPGEVGILLAISGGSSSGVLKTVVTDSSSGEMVGTKFIKLESSSKAVVLYSPSTGETTIIDSYSSPSYAKHTKRPYTSDDRLFLTNKWHGSGDPNLVEYDPASLSVMRRIDPREDGGENNLAVIGDTLYFRTDTEYDIFRRANVGGDYMRLTMSGTSGSAKLAGPDALLSLKSSEGNLYGVQLPFDDARVTAVDRLDPDTAQVVEQMVAFQVTDYDSYIAGSWNHVVVDNQAAYWLALSEQGANVSGQLLWYPLSGPDEEILSGEFQMPAGEGELTALLKFDVDDDALVLWPRYKNAQGFVDDSQLVLVDLRTGTVQHINTDLKIFDVQVISFGE